MCIPHLVYGSLGPHKRNLDRFSSFVGLIIGPYTYTDRNIDHATVCSNMPHLCYACEAD